MVDLRFGRYEVQRELGRGGMAVVYLARDPLMKRDVAIKLVSYQPALDADVRARFRREVEIVATLDNPCVVPVYDYSEEEDRAYIVMRHMRGGSLLERVAEAALDLPQTARILARIATALDAAHAAGIVHRDLKPSNILFDQHDEPYVSDFGIARVSDASVNLTGSGVIGTPAYMSPEQILGNTLDATSDVYALGVMTFQLLTGRLPFVASAAMEIALAHLKEPVPAILAAAPGLPPSCQGILQRAMAKAAAERHASAGAFARDIQQLAERWTSDATLAIRRPAPTPPVDSGPAGETVRTGAGIREVISPRNAERVVVLRRLTGHTNSVNGLAFSPDNRLLASAAADGHVRVWDVASGQNVAVLRGHDAGLFSVCFSPDGRTLASAGNAPVNTQTNTVRLWSVADYDFQRALDGQASGVVSVVFQPSRSASVLACATSDNTIQIWNAATGDLVLTIEASSGNSHICALAFDPSGRTLVSGDYRGVVAVWDPTTGQLLRTLQGHTGSIALQGVVFAPDGETIASGSWDGTVRIWNVKSGTVIRELESHAGIVSGIAVGAGSILVSGDAAGLRFWDLGSGQLNHAVPLKSVQSIAFSPDGTLSATGSADGTVRLWCCRANES